VSRGSATEQDGVTVGGIELMHLLEEGVI